MHYRRLPVRGSTATLLLGLLVVVPAGAQSPPAPLPQALHPQTLPAPAGAAAPAPRPPVPGAPAGATAFIDVAVVPMDSERLLPHQTVLVRGGRIAALGPVASTPVPRGAVQIDGRDRYLLPGFGTCHGHLSQSGWGFGSRDLRAAEVFSFMMLASGVTMLRNVDYMNAAPELISWTDRWGRQSPQWWMKEGDLLRLRTQAAAGELWSPRIYTAGQWAPLQYLTRWQVRTELQGRLPTPRLDSIAAYVAAYKAKGYNFLKLHDETPEIADSVLAAARRVGLQVGGHPAGSGSLEQAIAGGQRVIDHPLGSEWTDSAAAAVGRQAAARRRAGVWSCDVGPEVRTLTDSGAGVLLGGDGGTARPQLQPFVKWGLTPYQVLVTGTREFARYLRTLDPRGDEGGTIAVGQRADLVLLVGNPLADVRHAEISIIGDTTVPRAPSAGVMVGGRWLDSAELARRTAVAQLWWAMRLDTEDVLRAGGVDFTLPAPAQRRLQRLEAAHRAQRFALLERFVLARAVPAGGAARGQGAARLVALTARQLGAVRAALPAAARDRFDAAARAWRRKYAAAGYRPLIPGLRSEGPGSGLE